MASPTDDVFSTLDYHQPTFEKQFTQDEECNMKIVDKTTLDLSQFTHQSVLTNLPPLPQEESANPVPAPIINDNSDPLLKMFMYTQFQSQLE